MESACKRVKKRVMAISVLSSEKNMPVSVVIGENDRVYTDKYGKFK